MARAWNRLRRIFGKGRLIGLLLLVDLLILRAWDPHLLVAMRFKFFDMFQQWLPREEAAFPVTIVDIDEASLAELGQWPWPRSVLASLVNRLRQDGAAAIGFDVVFAEPDRNLSIDTARLLLLPPSDLKAALTNLQTNDAIFADAIKRGPVVLGEIGLTSGERPPAPPRDPPTTAARIGGDPRPYLYHFSSLAENIPELAGAASGRGNFSLRRRGRRHRPPRAARGARRRRHRAVAGRGDPARRDRAEELRHPHGTGIWRHHLRHRRRDRRRRLDRDRPQRLSLHPLRSARSRGDLFRRPMSLPGASTRPDSRANSCSSAPPPPDCWTSARRR